MAAPLTIGQAGDLVDVAIQKIWLKPSPLSTEYFKQFCNVTTGVTDLYTKDSSLTGFGLASRVTESATIISQSPVQGFDQTFTQVLYGTVGSFSWHIWKFGLQKRDLTKVVNELKKACFERREVLCAERLDAAYLTSYSSSDDAGNYSVTTTGGDGIEMASAIHTREDGGTTWSNINSDGTTTNMVLDYPGLKAMYRIAALTKTGKGTPMPFTPNRIIVKQGTTAAFRAKEILGALKNGKIPGEFSNDGAAISAYEISENPYLLGTGDGTSITNLSSATNWHMLDTKYLDDPYGLQYFESQGINLDEQNIVYKTKEIQYSATISFALGFNDPRGAVHSQGDNS